MQGYGKLVELQMKVDKLNDQVKDLTRLETINGKSYATKISDLQSKISTLKSKIDSEAQSYKMSKKTTKEVVVVFDKYSKRKQCLKEYEPYSKIDCKGGSMPDEMKLNHKHSFKVSEAPETFETQLEYKDSPWILPGLYMLFVWAVVGIISAFTLYFMYAEIDSAYNNNNNNNNNNNRQDPAFMLPLVSRSILARRHRISCTISFGAVIRTLRKLSAFPRPCMCAVPPETVTTGPCTTHSSLTPPC